MYCVSGTVLYLCPHLNGKSSFPFSFGIYVTICTAAVYCILRCSLSYFCHVTLALIYDITVFWLSIYRVSVTLCLDSCLSLFEYIKKRIDKLHKLSSCNRQLKVVSQWRSIFRVFLFEQFRLRLAVTALSDCYFSLAI
jgi:hypothetical protein